MSTATGNFSAHPQSTAYFKNFIYNSYLHFLIAILRPNQFYKSTQNFSKGDTKLKKINELSFHLEYFDNFKNNFQAAG